VRFGPLRAADLPAGEVTFWHPDDASLQALQLAPLDPRRPSPDQERRYADRAARDPDDPSCPYIAIGTYLPGATPESIAETLRRFVDRHETFRSALVPGEDRLERRTVPPGALSFRPERVGGGSPEEILPLVAEHFRRYAEPTSWPCLAAVTVTAPDGRTLVAMAVDHVSFDGVSGYLCFDELQVIHKRVLTGAPPPPPAVSYVDAAHRVALACEAATLDGPELTLWREALQAGLLRLPDRLDVVAGPDSTMSIDSTLIVGAPTQERLEAYAAAQGLRTPLLLLVLLEQALESDVEGPYYVATHNRRGAERTESIGWYAGIAPYLRTDPRTSLPDRARELGVRWREIAAAGMLEVPFVAQALGLDVRPTLVVSLVDLTAFPGHPRWVGEGAATWAGPVPPSGEIHLWLKRSSAGVSLEARHLTTPANRAWVEEVIHRFRTNVDQLVGADQPTTPHIVLEES
jgi:hypothetical protein